MSGNNRKSSSPPVGAPTAPHAMRKQQAAAAAASGPRPRQPSAGNYYPPLTARRIAPPPGLFQAPDGTVYNARSDASASRRISFDGQMYSQQYAGGRRMSQDFGFPRPGHRPGQLLQEQVLASHDESRRMDRERAVAQSSFAASQQYQQAVPAQQSPHPMRQAIIDAQRSPVATPARVYETAEQKAAREKAERIEKARKQFEKGRGFEDDDEFYAGGRRA
ncbi:hypothetical protein PG994_005428 [Apiospora phragmitis]|uniref:Uncharacterized protein n=1 Tax=Apiospora phragmitis TaxID=2905665 RepID=A0ABR1VD80_9PEZI